MPPGGNLVNARKSKMSAAAHRRRAAALLYSSNDNKVVVCVCVCIAEAARTSLRRVIHYIVYTYTTPTKFIRERERDDHNTIKPFGIIYKRLGFFDNEK